MFQHILVPLDGSARAEEALPLAARLARATNASLTLLRVVTQSDYIPMYPAGPVMPLEQEREAERYLMKTLSLDYLHGITLHLQVVRGAISQSIVHFASANQIDLIVIRSRGEKGFPRLVFGSVAQQVVRHSAVPVLVLRDGCPPSFALSDVVMRSLRILVALDGSPLAEAALLPAAQLCTALPSYTRGTIHLIRTIQTLPVVGDEPEEHVDQLNREAKAEAEAYLKNVEQRFYTGDLARFHLNVTSSVVAHSDAREIWKRVIEESEHAENVPEGSTCDIIAMATHGRHGLQHLLEGSITEHVLDAATHPLLVVHAQKAEKNAHEALDVRQD